MGTKQVAIELRKDLKKEFPQCKFSVRTEYFSGGSGLTLSIMKTPFKIKTSSDEITEEAIRYYGVQSHYEKDTLVRMQEEGYNQLNDKWVNEDYSKDRWNNGVFLTLEGHSFIKRVVELANQYNYDHSDVQTDYFDVNFWFDLSLGQFEKPLIEGEVKE